MNNCPDECHLPSSGECMTIQELMAKEFPDFCPTCGADLDAEERERIHQIRVDRGFYEWT